MTLLAPRPLGPVSACNRWVNVDHAMPGAQVWIHILRNGQVDRVGGKVVVGTSDPIPLDAGKTLAVGDVVSASQEYGGEKNEPGGVTVQVQKDAGDLGPPQLLGRLIACSRYVGLGALRPGTLVEIREGKKVLGSGEAIDGTVWVYLGDGLPKGTNLVVAQSRCPKPPPPSPATGYFHESSLPEPEANPFTYGQSVPAPNVSIGLTDCSRALHVTGLIPGAEVLIEGPGGWWSSKGVGDRTEMAIDLPVKLVEGTQIVIRQEFGRICELKAEKRTLTVGPRKRPDVPLLAAIECHTDPTIEAANLRRGADIEWEVTPKSGGSPRTYHTIAPVLGDTLIAPPMPPEASVRARQGECGLWSDWSLPTTAKVVTAQPNPPAIAGTLRHCQNAIEVELSYVAGMVYIISAKNGVIGQSPGLPGRMTIPVAPSLEYKDTVTVSHVFCRWQANTPATTVQALSEAMSAKIGEPLEDGKTSVTVENVIAGADVQLWEITTPMLLLKGRAPFSTNEWVSLTFAGLPKLKGGWQIVARFTHCGRLGETPPAPVVKPAKPPPSPPASGQLALELRADAPVVIHSVTWDVLKAHYPPPPTHEANITGALVKVSLPTPQSELLYFIRCHVEFEYLGFAYAIDEVAHDENRPSDVPGTARIGWSGKSATGVFVLAGANVSNPEGGYEIQFELRFWGLI